MSDKFQCLGCEKVWTLDELDEVKDADEMFPHKVCPVCTGTTFTRANR